ncbi:efflux RND transporter periplasmic adaptor subunit [Hydrogenophilus thiooxidans]|uniref:efflux RND transporter periplasmic adaptor subunit n=1 Tax=Hydrogenophilus thiooxidans TaxID=2820326 RepID=UPI001C2208C7|nr:efflux RND transporter periplasmic adaptor subunit [Hydrogenophilus thiooxidans]
MTTKWVMVGRRWVLGVALILGVASAQGAETGVQTEPLALPIATVRAVAAPARTFAATVRARHEVGVAFQVSGRLLTRTVEAGASVTKGAVLARLDTRDLEAALDAAKAQAQQAKAQWRLAQNERKRVAALFAKGFVGEQQLDRAKASEQAAFEAVQAAEAQVRSAQLLVAHAELKAPQDGVVLSWLAEPGQVVAAGQLVVQMALGAERELEVALPESLAHDAPKEGVAESPSGARFAVVWREQDGALDPLSRTVRARYRFTAFPLKETALVLGSVWRLTLPFAQADAQRLWQVPAAALDERGSGARVWRVAPGGQVTPVPVTVVYYGQHDAVVAGPLDEGQRIVAGGAHRLVPGLTVVEAR